MLKREDGSLRRLIEADLDIVLTWRNADPIRSVMYNDHIITPSEHKQWFARLEESSSSVHLIFELKGRPVGTVYYSDIDRMNRKCFWGFYLGEEGLPSATGLLMGILGMGYAFGTLQMHKLCGETFSFNRRGNAFFKKLGFRQEGLFREHILKNGVYEDVILYALLEDEWKTALAHIEGRFLS